MPRLLLLAFALVACHGSPPATATVPVPVPVPATATVPATTVLAETFELDGRAVTQAEFARFQSSLEEVPHTWYCAETRDGGETGYDGKDGRGVVFEIRAISEAGKNVSTIRRKR